MLKMSDSTEIMESITKHAMSIFFFILFMLIIVYISEKIERNHSNCTRINDNRNNDEKKMNEFYSLKNSIDNGYFKGTITINDKTIDYDYKLKDFYIKTAHNCFCAGDFSNDYVNKCALNNCASFGVRALDMQIFSKKDQPVIAANSIKTNLYKETYNHISLKDGLTVIKDTFFENDKFQVGSLQSDNTLKNDPLFLILRLHYDTNINSENYDKSSQINNKISNKQILFYDKIYNEIVSKYDITNLGYTLRKTYPNIPIPNLNMELLKNKIFIFVIVNGSYTDIKKSKLHEIVDLYGDDEHLSCNHFDELSNADTLNNINQYEMSQSLSICLPTRMASSKNMEFIYPMKKGVQFIGMNFQEKDSMLDAYNQFFISQYGNSENKLTSPYIKKPDHMIENELTLY